MLVMMLYDSCITTVIDQGDSRCLRLLYGYCMCARSLEFSSTFFFSFFFYINTDFSSSVVGHYSQ